MPNVRIPFPEEMTEPFIRFEEEFRKICTELNESDKEKQEQLAGYLHCLGIALTYRNDPRLREASVLKPQCVTKGVYRILTSTALQHKKGELHLKDLSQILPTREYPSQETAA